VRSLLIGSPYFWGFLRLHRPALTPVAFPKWPVLSWDLPGKVHSGRRILSQESRASRLATRGVSFPVPRVPSIAQVFWRTIIKAGRASDGASIVWRYGEGEPRRFATISALAEASSANCRRCHFAAFAAGRRPSTTVIADPRALFQPSGGWRGRRVSPAATLGAPSTHSKRGVRGYSDADKPTGSGYPAEVTRGCRPSRSPHAPSSELWPWPTCPPPTLACALRDSDRSSIPCRLSWMRDLAVGTCIGSAHALGCH
jgi:hypothetical protein